MSRVEIVNPYTPISTACYGWCVPKKKEPLRRKRQIKKNEKAVWHGKAMYADELLPRMFEETDKQIERQRFPGQEDFKQAEKRMGKLMHSSDFIRRVLAMNRNLIFEESISAKGNGAFYWMKHGRKVYTAANFKLGWIPEWTIMKTDTADLPTRDGLTYGWRVPLQRLIEQRAISKRQAEKIFGSDLPSDLRGRNWATATGNFN